MTMPEPTLAQHPGDFAAVTGAAAKQGLRHRPRTTAGRRRAPRGPDAALKTASVATRASAAKCESAGIRAWWPLLILSALLPCQAADAPQPRPSVLELPVEIDLAPAFAAAERLMPRQTGGPRWNDWHGIEVRYQAWRGPLLLQLQGDLLLVQAHIRYRAQGRKNLVGDLGISTGCGVDEPPRQALVGAAIRLAVAPDWTLRPQFRVLPTRFIDRCEITALDIDASPLVERAFRARMEDALRDALHELAPALAELRRAAIQGWRALQAPRRLGPDLWLTARPVGVGIAPLHGRDRQLSTVIGLALWPLVTTAEPAAAAPAPLPPLVPFRPSPGGLRFDVALDIPVDDLSAAVARQLSGQIVEVRGVTAVVEDAALSAAGGRLVLMATIGGDMPGTLDVRGRPALDAATGGIVFADLDFVFDSAHPDAELMLALFYERIRERLQGIADDALAERLEAARAGLEAGLGGWLGGRGRADLSGLSLTTLDVQIDTRKIAVRGQAQGAVNIVLE